jgi:hypothetical protein
VCVYLGHEKHSAAQLLAGHLGHVFEKVEFASELDNVVHVLVCALLRLLAQRQLALEPGARL